MKLARLLLCGAALAAAPLLALPSFVVAQDAPPAGAPQGGAPRGAPSDALGNDLVAAIQATKGCLGVELAFTKSRKSVIFAWFEDKAATLRFYESDYHQTMMMGMHEARGDGAAPPAERTPMEHVPDGVPVLCIATITPSIKPAIPGFPMPISQVSIELYTPLPGGLALNGRFTPAGVPVPHMLEAKLPAPESAAPSSEAGGGAGRSGSR